VNLISSNGRLKLLKF